MADNSTHPVLEILKSFGLRDVILAFCLSMVVGLVLGALVYMILIWMSRRRASATITRVPIHKSRSTTRSSSPRSRPGYSRHSSGYDQRGNNNLASAAFSFHRQTSPSLIDYGDSPGRKSSFRASTFHPLLQCSQIAREAEEGTQGSLPRTPTLTTNPGAPGSTSTVSSMVTPPQARTRPDSFWGNSNLKALNAGQTPPPAYESIIRAYKETTT
ncbi:myc target protein 1 homolog [Carassius auratus]|uniref:Myc target protein 1 homolog n=1 Tax=Carassius auratus TaxID=7957 RepID=A0A6P6LXP1_CARAU|nr:myc target protein 1 homolog [Carassius auratus]XP_052391495.1 myc target protein 1 homolog [Carassius gibelio]